MKATLTFNLPEEESEFQTAVKASDMSLALWEIAQEIFRPARKHGYSDQRIQNLAKHLDVLADKAAGIPFDSPETSPGATELIAMLEEKFYAILQERSIDLNA